MAVAFSKDRKGGADAQTDNGNERASGPHLSPIQFSDQNQGQVTDATARAHGSAPAAAAEAAKAQVSVAVADESVIQGTMYI